MQAGGYTASTGARSSLTALTLSGAKTGPRHVLLGGAARELMEGLAVSASGEWVLPGGKGNGLVSVHDLWWFWTKTRDATGIVAGPARASPGLHDKPIGPSRRCDAESGREAGSFCNTNQAVADTLSACHPSQPRAGLQSVKRGARAWPRSPSNRQGSYSND